MKTGNFTEQVFRQPKNAVRFTGERVQLSREWKIRYVRVQRPTILEIPMKYAALAAALLLAACQTQGSQANNRPVTVDGITFAEVGPGYSRDEFYATTGDQTRCLAHVAKMNPGLTPARQQSACECIRRDIADTLDEDLMIRLLDEGRGVRRPIDRVTLDDMGARLIMSVAASYRRCGVRYND